MKEGKPTGQRRPTDSKKSVKIHKNFKVSSHILHTCSRSPREGLRRRQMHAPCCKFKRRERVCAESSSPLTASYSLRSYKFLGVFAERYPVVGRRAQTRERPKRHEWEAGIWSCLGSKRRRKAPECQCMIMRRRGRASRACSAESRETT